MGNLDQRPGLTGCNERFADFAGSGMIGLMDSAITTAFAPLIGLPCWGVDRVQGSILSFEFGSPSLVVREPRYSNSASAKVRKRMAQRIVKPVGEWHLLIYACRWRVAVSGKPLATDSDTTEAIEVAVREMDGQKLTALALDAGSRVTTFTFDLGAVLTTRPYETDIEDQWSLHLPDERVLSYRSDGCYSVCPADMEPDQERWQPLAQSLRLS